MSDGEQLLLILSLIYLSGCLLWINRRTILFTSGFGRDWKAVVADYRWGNSSGRVFLLNPFPPLGFLFVSKLLPISLSTTNIVAYNVQTVGNSGRPPQSGRTALITPNMRFSRRGSVLIVDGKSFCDIGDVETAHKLVVLLNKIKVLDECSREKAICDFWRTRLNVHRSKKEIRAVMAASRNMRQFCALLFFVTFAILPLAAILLGIDLAVLLGAGILLSFALAICLMYHLCHSRYFPTCKDGLWGDLTKMMLCPPSAIRACDLIMEKLSARLDALPLAVLLLHGAERDVFLSEYLADLASPYIPDDMSDIIRSTCLWQNRAILRIGIAEIPMLKRFAHRVNSEPTSQHDLNQTRKENKNG